MNLNLFVFLYVICFYHAASKIPNPEARLSHDVLLKSHGNFFTVESCCSSVRAQGESCSNRASVPV